MKIYAIFLCLPILRALKLPDTHDYYMMADGLIPTDRPTRACDDKDILCVFVPDASACDPHGEIKLRCPKKCDTCPGRCILRMMNVYVMLNKCTCSKVIN